MWGRGYWGWRLVGGVDIRHQRLRLCKYLFLVPSACLV